MINRKILIGILILIFFLIGCYFEYKEESLNKKDILFQRQNITFIKFVSSENCMYNLNTQEIEELKSLNIIGIRICPLYSIRQDGKLKEDVPEDKIINLIEKAHQAGFAVFLEINAGGRPTESGMPEYRYDNAKYIDSLYNIALHWSKIAEEEKVEFYSPLNEPDLMFTSLDLVNQWINRSQDLRSVFSGNLVIKFADIGPEKIENIDRYDYLGYDIMWGDAQYQELNDHLNMAVEKGNSLKRKYKLKGFFFGEIGADRSRVDKNVQTQLFKIILEETWGKIDGYCFLGWSDLEFKFKDNDRAKEIIREYYAKK